MSVRDDPKGLAAATKAQPAAYARVDSDGCPGLVMRSNEEAAQVAIAAYFDALDDPLVPVSEVEKARADERAKVVSEVVEWLRDVGQKVELGWTGWTGLAATAIESHFAPGTGDDER
jgi:hypothetical protein